ncbi:hypothetical protein, variant [Aphanomyces invadans]|uniref:Phospholipid/glycerol acyltransferase domain-containing protein n=1 Tax=Aphanomyces invadans TaxID=157072 RepID=A0A024UH16_9STRA|nr:hypothetical protein, variant [Aphanomyces invadans]ETW05594.1 hypothetical protein, variant [Aphanomyces invadans]|eukprot:XP_008865371.1 hypothetical protein, variant [Aphanomyces invadans]
MRKFLTLSNFCRSVHPRRSLDAAHADSVNMFGLNDLHHQVIAIVLMIMLSMDVVNPVKAVCSVVGIDPSVVGWLHVLLLLGLLYNNMSDVLYFGIRVFLTSIISIFFKSIEIVGKDNIPLDGPVIFTGNHSNQFVDGMIVLMNCYRKVGFIIAEKSMHRPVIGTLAKAVGCIPFTRPQDEVIKGKGVVSMEPTPGNRNVLVGLDTHFTVQLGPGDQVRASGKTVKESSEPVKVEKVIDDTHVVLSSPLLDVYGEPIVVPVSFGIFKKIDQKASFSEVNTALQHGQCVGIFPEGGSHDRTDLLPLKAGVALMAFAAKESHNLTVPIVPVGLNYFRGHKFRGRVVVEFGAPISVTAEKLDAYHQDKRKACNSLLNEVQDGMRSVIVTTPDHNVLQGVYAARRLFQQSGIKYSPKATQDLNRRFAHGYRILNALPEAKEDVADLNAKITDYRRTLKQLGLADHQVPYVAFLTLHDVLASATYGLIIFALASIPSFVLNAPVGLLARYVAAAEQSKALAGSSVKIAARDVVLSKKISFSVVAVPVLWLFYTFLLFVLTDWKTSTILRLTMSFPLFSYFGVRSVEAGIIELRTLRPLLNRLRPEYKRIQDELPVRRMQLQKDVRKFVKKYAAQLGPLADPAPVDWAEFMHTHVKHDDEHDAPAVRQRTPSQDAKDGKKTV